MNKFNCSLCNSRSYTLLFTASEKEIVKCRECGLVKLLGNFDINYEGYHRDSDYEIYNKYFGNIFLKKYKYISKYCNRGKVLDIGSSTGIFIEIFKEHGFSASGVEPSGSAELARKKGIKVYKSKFEKIVLKKDCYDLVIMNHTLEHTNNPLAFVRKAARVLKKGGYLYLEVPNFGSLEANIFRKYWRFLLPREHIYQFTPSTLSNLVEKSGLKIQSIKTYSGVLGTASPLWHFKFQLMSGKKHFYKSFLIDLLTLPLDAICMLLGKGNALAIIAKKV